MNRRAKISAEEVLSRILAEDSSSDEEISDVEDTDQESSEFESDEEDISNTDSDVEDNDNEGWRVWRDRMDVHVLPYTAQNFVRLNPSPQSELDFFQLFFSDELLLKIVHETKRYAKQKLTGRTLTPRSIWKTWTDITLRELKAYLGVVMNMAINEKGSVQDYFSRDWIKEQPFF